MKLSFHSTRRLAVLLTALLILLAPAAAAEDVVIDFERQQILLDSDNDESVHRFERYEEQGVEFTLAASPKRSKSRGKLMFFPHVSSGRKGILNAMATEQELPVQVRFPTIATKVTITFWGSTGCAAELKGYNSQGELVGSDAVAVVPGRAAPEDPIPTFELTVAAENIAYVEFSGPRSGEFLAADEVRFSTANTAAAKHGFLACGSQTYIVDGEGKRLWKFEHGTRDGYVLADGKVLLTLNKSATYPGGAVVLVSRNSGSEPQVIWNGTQAEVNSAQPTATGTVVLTEAGPKPRLLEVDYAGKVMVEFPLQCQLENHHMQTRMARKLPDGTYLAPHLLDFVVRRYNANGEVLGEFSTVAQDDSGKALETWPFTAIRHGDEQTLVCLTHGNRVVDFDRDGKITWQLTNADLPGPWLQDPCGAQVLHNGNVVVTSYAAGQADPAAPKLMEITRDKQVVWTYRDNQPQGIHHFQILDADGQPLPNSPQK